MPGERRAADDGRTGDAATGVRGEIRRRRKDKELFLAAGASGAGAVYTHHLHAIHIIRKVILRVGAYTDYLILKLH